jgi:hypothetical protein
MIDFSEAENKFRELQGRVQRGEPLSEEQYQEELAKLMVQDDHGIFWSLEPGTGRWLFFNGTEWVPGTPPRPASPAEPMPTAAAQISPAPASAEGATEAPSVGGVPSGEAPQIEAESVPTYVRTTEVREAGPPVGGGIPPRPIRGTFIAAAEGDRPWLPFAIGAIVLMLCAIALFFGVKNAPFLAGAAPTMTATEVAILDVSPTVEIAPTDTRVPTPTSAPTTPTPNAVTVATTDNVRVRAGPGTKFGVLATVASGTTMTAVGRNADNSWIQIQQTGKTDLGWVSAQFVTVSGDLNSLPVQSEPTAVPGPTKKPTVVKPTPTETPAG